MGIILRLELLQPRAYSAVSSPNAALAFAVHHVRIVDGIDFGQLRVQRRDPLTGRWLAIGRLPMGGSVEGDANLAQPKWSCR